MITDLPTSDEFEKVARDWLNNSFDILYEYSKGSENLSFLKIDGYKFNKTKLSGILVLIHQALEAKLKSVICIVSPLLLLDLKQADWPTLPDSKNKSFNDLYTLGADALIKVFGAINSNIEDTRKLASLFDEIRIKRNKIVHNLYKDELTVEYLLELLFKVSAAMFSTDLFSFLRENDSNFPYDEFYAKYPHLEDDRNISILTYRYHLQSWAEGILGNKRIKTYLHIEGRPYNCYWCWANIDKYQLKTAYLHPNSSVSESLACINCLENFNAQRRDCNNNECKGNIVYQDRSNETICLTCGTVQ
jgi:hypothetical protein